MLGLIPPHGGISQPVNCTVTANEVDEFLSAAGSLKKIPVPSADLSTVYRIGDGTLSPLTGFMNSVVFQKVLEESAIETNGKKFAWTIPLSLPVSEEVSASISTDETVALTDTNGEIVATLQVEDIFAWEKTNYLKSVYGTERIDHPGADMALVKDAEYTRLVGGSLRVLPQPKTQSFSKYILSPSEVRAKLTEKGWDAVVAFQTRNPLHRAHEYALVYGLETLLREGKNGGAVLNPLVGETKGDDVSAEIRMQTYESLIENREMGDGDSDPSLWDAREDNVPDRVLLLGLDIKMFYGGPKEAVMHAIYRQNMGYTHIVIGRKHADAPYHDGSAIWGDFDAQEIFQKLNGELQIQPLKVGFAAFYESLGRVDLMSNHPEEKSVFISGKEVRATLQRGEMVDPRIMRESTSKILARAMHRQ